MAITGSQNIIYRPGDKVTFKSAAAVTAGRLVEITAANTVGMAAAKSQKVVGFAMQSCDAAGDQIEVQILGYIVKATAQGAVAAGDELVIGSVAGTVAVQAVAAGATATDINNARAVLGIALEAISDTNKGRVLISRA